MARNTDKNKGGKQTPGGKQQRLQGDSQAVLESETAGNTRGSYEPPSITYESAERPALTHLCSYASSHTNRSTTRQKT